MAADTGDGTTWIARLRKAAGSGEPVDLAPRTIVTGRAAAWRWIFDEFTSRPYMPLPAYSGWHQCTAGPRSRPETCVRTEGYGTDNCHGFVPHLQPLV